jgi:hypothetical protein
MQSLHLQAVQLLTAGSGREGGPPSNGGTPLKEFEHG